MTREERRPFYGEHCPDCRVLMRLINVTSREFQCPRCTAPDYKPEGMGAKRAAAQ